MISMTLAGLRPFLLAAGLAMPTGITSQQPVGTYPPCQRGVIEDRCNQLPGRGDDESRIRTVLTAPPPSSNLAGSAEARRTAANPIGSSPNDPVDTQRPGLITRNARGIDADGEGAPEPAELDPR